MRRLLFAHSLLISFPYEVIAQNLNSKSYSEEIVLAEIDTLFRRISFDDVEGVKKLLMNKDLSPNTLSKYGDASLPYAVKEDAYKVFKYLLQVSDINVNMENKSTENALMMLAFKGKFELVKYMVEEIGAEPDKDGWTPLHYAATSGHLDIVKFLISKEVDVDAQSPSDTTPLMMAARYGHIKVVKYLLDNEADLSLKNTHQLTAIDFAYLHNQKEIGDGLRSRWKKLYGEEYVLNPRLFPSGKL
jgi:ankyrin repeat protein